MMPAPMPPPTLLNTARDLERLSQIVGVLGRHGFGEVMTRSGLGALVKKKGSDIDANLSVGERIRHVLQDLGASFIKLGQIASTRPDLIPPGIVTELKKLQDDVPPEEFDAIREVIEAELGAPLGDLFESFEEEPLASASIGQVHRATLRTEDGVVDVVVKVQRPKVRDLMSRDIDLLYWLAHAVERSVPEAKLYNPVKLVTEFDHAANAELDFTFEADNCERFARNFAGKPYVKLPAIYREVSAKRVLTQEFLRGEKIDQCAGHEDAENVAKVLLDILIQQVFEDGFFHADPHPGNLFLIGTPSRPTVGIIDVGLVGHLSPQLRDRVVDMMVAAVREDYRGLADAIWAIGRPTRKIDRQAYEAEVTRLSQKYLNKELQDIEVGALIRDLVGGARKFGIEIPGGFLMMGKALMTIEGVGKSIFPTLDVMAEMRPYFLKLMYQRYSPDRVGQDLLRSATRLTGVANEIPIQVQEILEDLRSGAFRLKLTESNLVDAADRVGRRLFSGLVVTAMLLSGAHLYIGGEKWIGGIVFGIGVAYGMNHSVLVWMLDRGTKRRIKRENR